MILRRVELMGFKSFADRTSIEFGPGISAIVGPNGSGKSNVVDAVRWVLGEGSARALRGQRMEDVIFGGTPRRRPVPLAEVTLTLDNADGTLPVAFAEVSVTRRLDRNANGEYLINRRPCRLRDVQELFAGTGLGRNSFALLGQGEVEEALRARPAERRAMVEEAAGVSRFHMRLHEGRRRLQGAATHEQRLADIVQERQRGLGQLARQAERAERHRGLSAELRRLELGLAAREWMAVEAQRAAAQSAAETAGDEAEALQEELVRVGERQREAAAALAGARSEAEAAGAEHQEARRALERARQEVEMARRLTEAARQQAARAAARGRDLRARRVAVEAEVAAAGEAAATAAAALEEARLRVAASAARLQEATRGRQEAALAFSRVQAALAACRQQASELAGGREDLRRALEAERGAAERRARADSAVASGERALASARAALAHAEGAVLRARTSAQEVRHHRDALREWVGGQRGRLQTIQEVLASGAGYAQGVRTVMAGKARGLPAFAGVVGPLGDLLDVPGELAAAISAALGGAVQDIVAVSPEAAEQAILALKAAQGGRATFLPLGGLAAQPPPVDLRALGSAEGARGWAADLIHFAPEIREAVVHTLGRVLVATELSLARGLARRSAYRLRVVTLDGEVVHAGGAMSGGLARGERRGGLVGREAEQRRLALRLQAAEGDLRALDAALGQAGRLLEAAEADAGRLRRQAAQCDSDLAAARAALRGATAEEARAAAEHRRMRERLLHGTRAEAVAGGAPAEAAGDPDVDLTEREARLERTSVAAATSLAEAERGEAAAREEATAARIDAAAAEQERRGAEGLAGAGRRELAELDARWQEVADDEQRATADADAQEGAAVEGASRAEQAEGALGAGARRLDAAQAALAQAQQEISAAAARREWCERERERALTALRRAEVELARSQAQQAALAGRLEAGYGLQPEALRDVEPSQRPGPDRERAAVLREELGGIGGVRPESVEEHRREAEEVAAFSAAVDDVRATALGLMGYAREIEAQLDLRYTETLAAVRQHFAAAYQRLCGGGRADLVPVETAGAAVAAELAPAKGPGAGATAAGEGAAEPDRLALSRAVRPAESPGLEIVAQPPGKQPAHLELLSGGERTLVAVALLLAFLRVRPTAFCILDEVEAALDEANVERCARYLTEMAEGTQFIVVTHQKGTMEAADRLVGVTMGEAGVSTLLSVRLAG